MKRLLESYIILLKEDLKIADTCQIIKNALLEEITDNSYFSEDLTPYFVIEDREKPFVISPTEPTQVAVLKKFLNILTSTEKTMRALENIDIDKTRYTAGMVKDITKNIPNVINEFYEVLQLINHSSVDIQKIAGPYLNSLLPTIMVASELLSQYTAATKAPLEEAGNLVSQAISSLPEKEITAKKGIENISTFIVEVPQMFQKLQLLITPVPLSKAQLKFYKAKS